jgi:hypothetical protein
MLQGSKPLIFVVDQVAVVVDQVTTSTSTSILMLLGYGPFFILLIKSQHQHQLPY